MNLAPQHEGEQPPLDEKAVGSITQLALWLVIFSIGGLIVPLYLVWMSIETSTDALRAERAGLQAELDGLIEMQNDTTQVDELTALQEQALALQTVQEQLLLGYTNMPDIVAALNTYDPSVMSLTSIQQDGNVLTISGRAPDQRIVIQYTDLLRESGQFEQVTIEDITRAVLPTPARASGGSVPPTPVIADTSVDFTIIVVFEIGQST